jgi:antitoxin component YwqK of YwqJK toxin-antitoxin module
MKTQRTQTFGILIGLLLLQISGRCQDILIGYAHVRVTPTSLIVTYQNKNYNLLLFPNSAKYYYQLDSLRGLTPAVYLPDSAKDGNYIAFYDFANEFPVAIFSYKNSVPDGLICWYNENGYPVKKANYQNGKLNGFTFFYDGYGNLKQLEEYKNDKQDGCSISFFDASHPSIVCYYKNDLLNGEFRQWAYRMNNEYFLKEHLLYKNNKVVKHINDK